MEWLLILLLLCIITIYVLVEPVLTDQRRETKSTQETPERTKKSEETAQAHNTIDKGIQATKSTITHTLFAGFKRSTSEDAGADAAPHTWRHYKHAPKEVMIIESFGNHNQWELPLVNNLHYFIHYNFAEE